MLDSVKKLRAFMARFPHDHVPSTLEFLALDVEKLKSDLELEARGRERGSAGLPPGTQSAFDDVEMEIINRIEGQARTDRSHYDEHMAVYSQRLQGMGLHEYIAEIKSLALGALAEFKLEVSQGRDALYDRRRDVVEFEALRSRRRGPATTNGFSFRSMPRLRSRRPRSSPAMLTRVSA